MGKGALNSLEDFLTNDSYLCFVFEQTPSLKKYWDEYFQIYPQQVALGKEAKRVLLYELGVPAISSQEKNELKEKILKTIGV